MKTNTQALNGPRVHKLTLVYLTNLFSCVGYEGSNGQMTAYDIYKKNVDENNRAVLRLPIKVVALRH